MPNQNKEYININTNINIKTAYKNLSTIQSCTLHSHNLTFTTFVQLDFRVLHLHNLKSLSL